MRLREQPHGQVLLLVPGAQHDECAGDDRHEEHHEDGLAQVEGHFGGTGFQPVIERRRHGLKTRATMKHGTGFITHHPNR
jgi:hypothetical protein